MIEIGLPHWIFLAIAVIMLIAIIIEIALLEPALFIHICVLGLMMGVVYVIVAVLGFVESPLNIFHIYVLQK